MNDYCKKFYKENKVPKFIIKYLEKYENDVTIRYIIIKQMFEFMINKKRINKEFIKLKPHDIILIRKVDIYQFLKRCTIHDYKEYKEILCDFYEYLIENGIINVNIISNVISMDLLISYIIDKEFEEFEEKFQISIYDFYEYANENEIEAFVTMFKISKKFFEIINYEIDYNYFENVSHEEKENIIMAYSCSQKLLVFYQILNQFTNP